MEWLLQDSQVLLLIIPVQARGLPSFYKNSEQNRSSCISLWGTGVGWGVETRKVQWLQGKGLCLHSAQAPFPRLCQSAPEMQVEKGQGEQRISGHHSGRQGQIRM